MPARVLNRDKGKSPKPFDPSNPDHVYIGRAVRFVAGLTASKWANPFTVGKDGDRAEVLAKFRAYLHSRSSFSSLVSRSRCLAVLGAPCYIQLSPNSSQRSVTASHIAIASAS